MGHHCLSNAHRSIINMEAHLSTDTNAPDKNYRAVRCELLGVGARCGATTCLHVREFVKIDNRFAAFRVRRVPRTACTSMRGVINVGQASVHVLERHRLSRGQ